MTEHEKQELVNEGSYEWCEECKGEGRVVEDHHYGFIKTYICGWCDGEGIVAKGQFNA